MIRILILLASIILEQIGLPALLIVNPPAFDDNKFEETPLSLLDEIHPVPQKISDSTIELGARSFISLDKNTNVVLAEKDSDISIPMASLTKIMTAVIVLEKANLDDELTVSAKAVAAYGEGIDLRAGEHLTVRDTLYASLLNSSNDASVALAEHVSRNEEDFVKLMNEKAELLKLDKTHYVNATGIDDPAHNSSVKDLARLSRYALLDSTFAEIVSTKEKVVTSKEGINHYLRNSNKLLGNVPEVMGVKTGFTDEAGECLVTYSVKDEKEIVTVVLGSDDRFGDSKKLINWSFENYLWK